MRRQTQQRVELWTNRTERTGRIVRISLSTFRNDQVTGSSAIADSRAFVFALQVSDLTG
jgi:hypothetical protein